MEKPKLNLADLTVSSFDPTPADSPLFLYQQQLSGPRLCFDDPTAETRCFYCPPATVDGCY